MNQFLNFTSLKIGPGRSGIIERIHGLLEYRPTGHSSATRIRVTTNIGLRLQRKRSLTRCKLCPGELRGSSISSAGESPPGHRSARREPEQRPEPGRKPEQPLHRLRVRTRAPIEAQKATDIEKRMQRSLHREEAQKECRNARRT